MPIQSVTLAETQQFMRSNEQLRTHPRTVRLADLDGDKSVSDREAFKALQNDRLSLSNNQLSKGSAPNFKPSAEGLIEGAKISGRNASLGGMIGLVGYMAAADHIASPAIENGFLFAGATLATSTLGGAITGALVDKSLISPEAASMVGGATNLALGTGATLLAHKMGLSGGKIGTLAFSALTSAAIGGFAAHEVKTDGK